MSSFIDNQPEKTIKEKTISDLLSEKKGLSAIKEIIDDNKLRLKTLLQTQQEQFLMAKLEVLLNRQVSINDVMSAQVDVDNIKFFEDQGDQDKELILLLANRDFIKTLRLEKQMQSKDLQQKYSELVKKDDEEEEEQEEEKENEGNGEGNSDGFNNYMQVDRNEIADPDLANQEGDGDLEEEQKEQAEEDSSIKKREEDVIVEEGETDQKGVSKNINIHPNKNDNSLESIDLKQEARVFSFEGDEQSSGIPEKTEMDLEKDREPINDDKENSQELIVTESVVESTEKYQYSQEAVLVYDRASEKGL